MHNKAYIMILKYHKHRNKRLIPQVIYTLRSFLSVVELAIWIPEISKNQIIPFILNKWIAYNL